MTRKSLSELIQPHSSLLPYDESVPFELLADEADYRISCLESKIADLEQKFSDLKITLARVSNGLICSVCGALDDEECDAKLHGRK